MKEINFGKRKRKMLLAFATLGLTILLFVIRVYTATNFQEPNFPHYSGSFAAEDSKPVQALTIVSYNIWFGENIDQALLEIREIRSQNELDIIFLQEMDEVGTERIARELQMNYVYFPAAIEPTYDRNFGNAILSRWAITDPKKLILPHQSFSNRMNRIATRALITTPGADILVYSIHTESVFTFPWYRKDQYKAVLDDIDPEAQLVIVGGDFNTYTDATVEELGQDYKQAGFIRASEGSGSTVIKYGIEMSTDHIFTKGFLVEDAEKLVEATASDHLPIWVTLIPK